MRYSHWRPNMTPEQLHAHRLELWGPELTQYLEQIHSNKRPAPKPEPAKLFGLPILPQ